MKNLNTLIFCLLLIPAIIFSQEKASAPKAKTNKQAPAPAAPLHDEALCKAWKMVNYERFSVVNLPNESEMKDGVTLLADGTAFLIFHGVQKTGTWSNDKTKTWANLLFDNNEKFRFKIITLNPKQLVYTYQDAELMTTKYTCEPLKK